MMRTPKRVWIPTIGMLACIASVGCADSTSPDAWEYDEPAPESRVDPSACTELPNDDLEEPEVAKTGESRWKIRYPSFRQNCGGYQLDAVVDFGADESDEASYTHTFTACNRCESAQTWNYLPEVHGSDPTVDSEREAQPVPKSPEIRVGPGVSRLGRPLVGHRTSSDDQPVYEMCGGWGPSGSGRKVWVQYDAIWQLALEPGESSTTSIDLDVDEAIPGLRQGLATSDEAPETTIRWPTLYHSEVDITGLQAASAPEFCVEHAFDERPAGWVRLYEEPYDVDSKYTRQTTPAPELPAELVERLRERAGDDER